MKSINIKEFQKNIYLYINNLPVELTRRGEVIAVLHPPASKVATTPLKVATLSQTIENKEEIEVATKVVTCEKCKLECDKEDIRAHWEEGEERRVCLYCLKKKKREPKKEPTKTLGTMNDNMRKFLKL